MALFVLFCIGKFSGDKTPATPPSAVQRAPISAPVQSPVQSPVQAPGQAPVPVANTAPARLRSFVGLGVAAIDGDTIKVLKNDVAVIVRLSAIDAPEMKQAFGPKAKKVLSSLTFGQTLAIYPTAIDPYGRYTARVFRGDLPINAEMVRRGMAWRYDRYARGDTKLLALQRRARAKRVGLWRDARPVAPWLWLKSRKS